MSGNLFISNHQITDYGFTLAGMGNESTILWILVYVNIRGDIEIKTILCLKDFERSSAI